jgi:hypothetical protein
VWVTTFRCGDAVLVVVSRMRFSRWRFGRLAGIDGQLNGGANLRRGQSIQVGAQVVVRVPGRSKPSGGGLRHIPAPSSETPNFQQMFHLP